MVARGVGVIVFPQDGSQRNRTRATIKALTTPRPPPSPLQIARLRLMCFGLPRGSLWQSFTDPHID